MLKYQVESLDAVEEAQRALYAEHTDDSGAKSFRLALELPEGVEVASFKGLKTALAKERDNAREAERLRKELEARLQGLDPATLQAELESQRRETAARESRLQTALVAASIERACAAARGNPELLAPMLEKRTAVREGVVVVLDDIGAVRPGVTVSALVAEMSASGRFDGAFAGTGNSGGGSHGVQGGKGSAGTLSLSGRRRGSMSPSEKVAALKELGTDGFMRLPP